ncbi:MAG TPA: hypothetical protein VFP40_11385 [Terriglobales bacterium]|nr:hypothetical protein [Terriglobales bacterium]
MLKFNGKLGRIVTSGTVLAGLLTIASVAGMAQSAAKGKTPGNDEVAVGASGQQVAIDAKSGKLRQPTQEEIQALVAGMKLNDSAEGLTAKRVGNGSQVMNIDGRFENMLVARTNPDGSVSTSCVSSKKQAEAFLKADTTKAEEAKKAKNDPTKWEEK